jgi:hypothetical protein
VPMTTMQHRMKEKVTVAYHHPVQNVVRSNYGHVLSGNVFT